MLCLTICVCYFFSLIKSGLGVRSLQYLMFNLWRRCVGAARLQLRLFDLLSLEDVQYLSAWFPIILPMVRSKSFFFSLILELGNYQHFLTAHICSGNDKVIRVKCWIRVSKILVTFDQMPVVLFGIIAVSLESSPHFKPHAMDPQREYQAQDPIWPYL